MKISISIIIAFLAFALTACSGGSSKVNAFLDTYENTIQKFEKKADSRSAFTISDINEMNQQNMELSSQASALKGNEKWTESQQKRYVELSGRLSSALQKMAQNIR